MAKVIKSFPGAPDGDPRVRQFDEGDEVFGDLARVAIAQGWAIDGQGDPDGNAKNPRITDEDMTVREEDEAVAPPRPKSKAKRTPRPSA